jgi:hypothetical protein
MSAVLSLRVTVSGSMPTQVTDREAMVQIAADVVTIIRRRTNRGQSAKGEAFKPYSTRPISIGTFSQPGTGRRLAPKGGVLSKSGKSMRFAGGYAEYKRLSRGAGALPATGYAAAAVGPSGEVDLLLSGELRRSIEVAQADEDSAVVQTGTRTATYAGAVNALRPFMGLAPGDRAQVEAVLKSAVLGAIPRRRAR